MVEGACGVGGDRAEQAFEPGGHGLDGGLVEQVRREVHRTRHAGRQPSGVSRSSNPNSRSNFEVSEPTASSSGRRPRQRNLRPGGLEGQHHLEEGVIGE